MDINDRYKVGKAMREHGGSFVQALGQAIAHADGENCRRIMQAFPEYWASYTDLADLGDSVFDCQKAQDDTYPTPNAEHKPRAVASRAPCSCSARGYWFRCKCGQAICNNCGNHYDDTPNREGHE